MNYEEALKNAQKIIETSIQTITEIIELNDSWVFLSGSKEKDKLLIDGLNLRIYKNNRQIDEFRIPPVSNIELIQQGKTIFKIER